MSSLTLSEKIRQKVNLKSYLRELSILVGRDILPEELGGVEQAVQIRNAVRETALGPPVAYDVLFSDLRSDRFFVFVNRLYETNSSPVYVWTPRTESCGFFLARSIVDVKFDFDFDVNSEGIFSFLTDDLKNILLIEFLIDENGGRAATIEVRGDWASVIY